MSVATNYGGRIRAAISDSGASNLVTFVQGTAGWRRDIQRAEYGDERDPKTRKYLESIAPINNVERINTPLMITQGQNDPRVPVTEAQRLVAALKKRGVPVWYLLARDEGHGWKNPSNWDFRLYSTALFVQEQLLK